MRTARLLLRFSTLLYSTIAAIATIVPFAAGAHDRSMSYSTFTLDDAGATVELRVKLIELSREPPDHAWTASLPGELALEAGGLPCRAGFATRERIAPEGWAVFRWRVACETSGDHVIRSRLLEDSVANHAHFVRVEAPSTAAGALVEAVLVTNADDTFALDAGTNRAGARAPNTFSSFVRLGAEHIGSGWDHLAFVLALLLLARTFREVAVLVTSFTAAHSLTLALAVAGVVQPRADAVEALIALSIALVAAENGWLLAGRDRMIPTLCVASLLASAVAAAAGIGVLRSQAWLGAALFAGCHFGLLLRSDRPARLRAALAFGFGLLHGFGFAGALMELALPPEDLVSALFGFNVGVEIGQLIVVAIIWPLLALLARFAPASARLATETASAAILALGLFWVAERAF